MKKTPVQAAEMVRACQAAAALPMLVGVGRRGRTVNRISGYPAFRDNALCFAAGAVPGGRL